MAQPLDRVSLGLGEQLQRRGSHISPRIKRVRLRAPAGGEVAPGCVRVCRGASVNQSAGLIPTSSEAVQAKHVPGELDGDAHHLPRVPLLSHAGLQVRHVSLDPAKRCRPSARDVGNEIGDNGGSAPLRPAGMARADTCPLVASGVEPGYANGPRQWPTLVARSSAAVVARLLGREVSVDAGPRPKSRPDGIAVTSRWSPLSHPTRFKIARLKLLPRRSGGSRSPIRSALRSFPVRPGRVYLEFERVIEENGRYIVVEKFGEAAEVVKALDPRSQGA
jgi:hypothetical protein